MSRYIKGKPDFADCEKCSRTYGTLGCCSTVSNEWVYSCLEGMLEKAYANGIKSVEPKRGEWIDMGDFEQCSVCKGTHLKEFQSYYGKTTWVKTPYCPNCGADMRERKESE